MGTGFDSMGTSLKKIDGNWRDSNRGRPSRRAYALTTRPRRPPHYANYLSWAKSSLPLNRTHFPFKGIFMKCRSPSELADLVPAGAMFNFVTFLFFVSVYHSWFRRHQLQPVLQRTQITLQTAQGSWSQDLLRTRLGWRRYRVRSLGRFDDKILFSLYKEEVYFQVRSVDYVYYLAYNYYSNCLKIRLVQVLDIR